MDDESKRAWLVFIHAEQAHRTAMGELGNLDLETVLRTLRPWLG